MKTKTLNIAQLEILIEGEKDQLLRDWIGLEIYLLEQLLVDIYKYSEQDLSALNKYLTNIFFAAELQFSSPVQMTDLFYRSLSQWATLYFDKLYEIDKVYEQGPDVMKSFAYVARLLAAGSDRVRYFLSKEMGKVDSIDLLLSDLKNVEFELNQATDGNIAYHVFQHFKKKALEV